MTTHLIQKPDQATLESLADFICGDDDTRFPAYRSSSYLTLFFESVGINAVHDGSTRKWWTLDVLNQLNVSDLEKVILRLVDIREYKGNRESLELAVKSMNDILSMEDMKVAFQGKTPFLEKLNVESDPIVDTSSTGEKQDFLKKEFYVDISGLGLSPELESVVQLRIDEIHKTENAEAALSSIFLAGSTLEGVLLNTATLYSYEFVSANASPKDKNGKVKPLPEWGLSGFIDTAYELGFIGLDVQKFSHVLRDFRNYIHPYQQAQSQFDPDSHTSEICAQVLKAAVADIANEIKQRS